ncbi:MAG TPA: PAS domain S-box protein [Anaerolineae bacterium]|nr:PAS domain S-box protein [Anaerolineae bacterium]HQI85280.1 PAS domain S-box protein [Anaerolineae bacterium]
MSQTVSDQINIEPAEEQSFSERLALLTTVSNELSKAKTLDELCRRAVEAGREQLGFDRVALFFVTEDRGTMIGTYGTDNEGRTTDERAERHAIVAPSGLHTVVSGAVPFRLYKNAPVFRGDGQQVGVGDRIAVGLWNGETVIGFLSMDNFIHRRPFTEHDCEIARLYASTVGHLCTLKRAQDELAQFAATLEQRVAELTKERFRDIFENSPIGIYQTTPDGRFLTANPAFIRMLNYTSYAEMVQHNLNSDDYFPDYSREAFRQRIEREGRIIGLEATWTRKDGSRLIVRENARTVRDAEGRVLYYEGTAEDITAWVQAEEERERLLVEVREQAQQIQRIIDTVPDGVLVLDGQNKVLLINPAGQKDLQVLANVREGDVLESLGGHPLDEFLTWSEGRFWREIEANGQTFEVIARPIQANAEAPHWLLVVRDVTQQRKIEEHANRQQQLAVMGQMAAGIAHDFNNILAVIMLYSQMALRTPDLSEKLRERLTIVYQQGQRASELINQILDFSRSTPLDLRPLDLAPLLKELDRLWQRTLPENINIRIVDDPEANYVVAADPTRIRQMLMNLVVNARDAMPGGGELTVRLEHIRFRTGQVLPLPELHAGEWIRVSVSDTGTGIPDDVLPHIFEPFYTTKPPDQGTGLGLAQVFGIVALHKGAIDVKTTVGQGTTFLVYLLASDMAKHTEAHHAADELILGHQETILVIEDNPQVRETLVDGLTQLNYRVIEARQGKEALALCERHKDEIALVLSDWIMPEMGGRDLVRALRARGLAVPVIVLSGHPLDSVVAELQESKIVWLQKPLTLEHLARSVDETIIKGET